MSDRPEVALLVDPAQSYDRRIVHGVAAFVERNQLDWSLYAEEDAIARLPDLDAWAGDGIIANFDDRRIAEAVMKLTIPVVGIGGGYGYYQEDSGIPYVRTDERAISALAAEHLLNLGLVRFAFCNEPTHRVNRWAIERADAFRNYIQGRGFSCATYTGRYSPSKRWRQSQAALQKWLTSLQPPLGLMACTDARARHVLQACREIGLRVPEDVAVVGVDNDDVMCDLARPPLTSVEHGTKRIGYEAAALLDRMMHGQRPPKRVIAVAPKALAIRQSTDMLAIDDEEMVSTLRFIRQHACDPISVDDVLHSAQLSRSTLESRFHEALGRSIYAEIRRVQVETACRLLSTTNLSITEIAHRVGASSVQYFSNSIRKATGKTPGQIRAESLQ